MLVPTMIYIGQCLLNTTHAQLSNIDLFFKIGYSDDTSHQVLYESHYVIHHGLP